MKTTFLYGPQGTGKTVHAEAIRQSLGLDRVIDQEWRHGDRFPPTGALVITNEQPPNGWPAISIEEAKRRITS